MHLFKVITAFIIILVFINPFSPEYELITGINEQPSHQPLVIYFFYAHGCSYCENASAYLQELQEIYPTLEIRGFDVYLDPDARLFYRDILAHLDRSAQGMPTIIIGERIWVGFQKSYQQEIMSALNTCLSESCPDISAILHSNSSIPIASNTNQPTSASLELPIFGEISLTAMPLIISTLIIGFVDGFNPCSLWVLTILLSLALYMQSRPRILLVGLTFITISSLTYALFISGLFTVLSILEFHAIIQILLSITALIFAAINIKDYFSFKKGPSLTISDQFKPSLYQRMRHLISLEKSSVALVFGTIVLSAGVSLMEFSCTAGFPIIWVNLLAKQQITGLRYIFLLLLYLIIYMLDELGIFFSVVITMRSIKLNTQQGHFLKLLSGLIMLALAVIMLIQPELMNSIPIVLIIFAAVIAVTFLVDQVKRHFE